MGREYTRLLEGVEGLHLPPGRTDYAENMYWVYGIVLDERIGLDAEQVMNGLGEKNIGTRPFFYPMHKQPVFRKMG